MLDIIRNIFSNKKETRKLNPRLGILGILGFAGLAGIWTYQVNGVVFPFIFFAFFGFFGFFFEGKMSNTLMDERYVENRCNAELRAYRIGLIVSFISLIACSWDWFLSSNEAKLIFITISLSFVFALVIFLQEYLLYRYDYKDKSEE